MKYFNKKVLSKPFIFFKVGWILFFIYFLQLTISYSLYNIKKYLKFNDNPIIDIGYTENFGSLVRPMYTFIGAGSVDFVKLTDINDAVVYEDQFD